MKEFDCVRMKHEAQRRITEEMRGLSPEEQRRKTEEIILSDPILGPFWRRVRRTGSASERRREEP